MQATATTDSALAPRRPAVAGLRLAAGFPAVPGQPARREIAVLGLILLLALALRLPAMNQPLWYDEILTLETHLRLPWDRMLETYSMNHHYLFSLSAKAAMALFGEAPWVLRLPALILGLAGIAAAWALARDLGGMRLAHATALMLALSYHHIWFSTNARGYTGLAFWCTLGTILFLRGLRTPRPALWAGFGLCLALGTFTHLTGAFFFAALGVLWLGRLALAPLAGWPLPRGSVTWPLIGAGLGLALTAALYAPVYSSLTETVATVSDTSAVAVMQEYQSPLWTLAEAGRTAIGEAGTPVLIVGLLVGALVVIGACTVTAPAFGPAVVVHILLTMALLLAIGMRIWPRFFFPDIGLLMLLIVAGVAAICRLLATTPPARLLGARPEATLFVIATLLMAAVSLPLAWRNYAAPKQDLAGGYAIAAAEQRATPGARVYAVGYAAEAFDTHFHAGWDRIMTPEDYAAALSAPGPVLLVVAFPNRALRAVPQMAADRDAGRLSQVARLPGTLGDGAVLVLRR